MVEKTINRVAAYETSAAAGHALGRPRGMAPARQAQGLLHAGYAILPLVAGADKFFDKLGRWEEYLAPQVLRRSPFRSKRSFMRAVGVTEIAAGALVAMSPRLGGAVVSGWLCAIVANLVIKGDHHHIALRDLGLAAGAAALSRLSATIAADDRALAGPVSRAS